MNVCFHCGEPLRGSVLIARIEQQEQPVCCRGCQAVAELIVGSGLTDFYRYRDGHAARPGGDVLESDPWRVYEDPKFAAQFTQTNGEQTTVILLLEGLRCSACSWLVEQVLRRNAAIADASVNATTGRASVTWEGECTLAEVMRSIAQLGYTP